jgi:hypothetical protein
MDDDDDDDEDDAERPPEDAALVTSEFAPTMVYSVAPMRVPKAIASDTHRVVCKEALAGTEDLCFRSHSRSRGRDRSEITWVVARVRQDETAPPKSVTFSVSTFNCMCPMPCGTMHSFVPANINLSGAIGAFFSFPIRPVDRLPPQNPFPCPLPRPIPRVWLCCHDTPVPPQPIPLATRFPSRAPRTPLAAEFDLKKNSKLHT